jgi:hypothetical protein
MTSQTVEKTAREKTTSEVIGKFESRESALAAQQAIASVGISAQNISISSYTPPDAQVDAMGTTTGSEAGLWIGGFYGGVIGLVSILVITTWTDIPENSPFSRLFILGFTLVGAVMGLIYGKQQFAKQPRKTKEVGDPSIAHTFQVMVKGSPSEIEAAHRVLTPPDEKSDEAPMDEIPATEASAEV